MGSVQLSRRLRQWLLDRQRGNFTTHRDRHDPLVVQPLVAGGRSASGERKDADLEDIHELQDHASRVRS